MAQGAVLHWQGHVIHVIGLGVDGFVGLSPQQQAVLQSADMIIGGERHLASIPAELGELCLYPQPFSQLKGLLSANQTKRIAILASGDPLFYGTGAWLLRNLPADKLQFHAHISSVQAAFARIKKPWQTAQVFSLHGRPLQRIRSVLQKNRLFAFLTDQHSRPQAIAKEVRDAGLSTSTFWIAENLGEPEERVSQFSLEELLASDEVFSLLNVVIVETAGKMLSLPEFVGIDDYAFATDGAPGRGMFTKREVRLSVLSMLQPAAGEVGWDIGAGCGGVSVEWARWAPLSKVYAVECHPNRLTCLQENRDRFGVDANLSIVNDEAPGALESLPIPDAVFIGGSNGQLQTIFEQCWDALRPGGRIVVAAVTLDTRAELVQCIGDRDAQWTEIAISSGEKLGSHLLMRPQLPVLLVKVEKI